MLRHIFLTFALLTSVVAGDDSGWKDIIKDNLKTPLETLPLVTIVKSGAETIVSVNNPSREPLTYAGCTQDSPQVYREKRRDGRWVVGGWLVSATNVQAYTLHPGQTVDFRLSRNSEAPERICAIFSSPGSEKSSLILLLETP